MPTDDLKRWLGLDPADLPAPPRPTPLSQALQGLVTEGKEEAAAGVRDAFAAHTPAARVAREAAAYGLSPEQSLAEMDLGGRGPSEPKPETEHDLEMER